MVDHVTDIHSFDKLFYDLHLVELVDDLDLHFDQTSSGFQNFLNFVFIFEIQSLSHAVATHLFVGVQITAVKSQLTSDQFVQLFLGVPLWACIGLEIIDRSRRSSS